jgi:Fic family protein
MNLKLETEFSKAPILQEIDAQKKQIDSMRPLPPDVEGRVMQKLRLDWNYNSNAIEGNKLSYGETVAFLMEGITAKGKPLKDHLDIRGHNEAINFLLELVKDERPLSEADIRALHEMILVEPYDVKAQTAEGTPTTKRIIPGVYKTTANHVQTATGETHYYATPEETPAKMRELMEWYYEADSNTEIHPVVVAALFHHKFVEIHPFDDGNGRLSRILMNLVLLKKGFPPVVVKMDDRRNYYSLLSRADVGETWPFVEYIIESSQWSLRLYMKGAKGEAIDEEDDIDKELALYRIELLNKIQPQKKISRKEVETVIRGVFIPLLEVLEIKLSNLFNDVFEVFKITVDISPGLNAREYIIANEIGSLVGYSAYEHIIKELEKKERITSIYVTANLEGFKNPDNVFDASGSFELTFDDEDYYFTDNNNLQIIKFYDEKISVKDRNDIIESVLNQIKDLINHNSAV